MNHARGCRKTCLHRGLWHQVSEKLKWNVASYARESVVDNCLRDWAAAAGHYFASVTQTGTYLLEITFLRNSVNDLIQMLGNFEDCEPPSSSDLVSASSHCGLCSCNWHGIVKRACANAQNHFQGLCLECKDKPRMSKGNSDDEYWRQLGNNNGRWDKDCPVSHGENTSYVS